MAPVPLPWAGPLVCTGGFLNVNDPMIHDPMAGEWAVTLCHLLIPLIPLWSHEAPESRPLVELDWTEEQRWEGQGRGWFLSQLKRGLYDFLPRQRPGTIFLCGFSCRECHGPG